MKMTIEEFQVVMAHAVATGISSSPAAVNGQISSEDVGMLVYNRSKGIADGYFAAMTDDEESAEDAG